MSKSVTVHEMLIMKDPEKYEKLLGVRKELAIPITEKIQVLNDTIENGNKTIGNLRIELETADKTIGLLQIEKTNLITKLKKKKDESENEELKNAIEELQEKFEATEQENIKANDKIEELLKEPEETKKERKEREKEEKDKKDE